MELNAELIKKSAEHCVTHLHCKGCPLLEHVDVHYPNSCVWTMLQASLALINSQEQKIKELTEENERLKKDNEYILMQHKFQRRPSGDCWNDVIEKAKADTVRKMQERLCEGRVSNDPVVIATNVVAKEMIDNDGG